MRTVQPIREIQKIEEIRKILSTSKRNQALFLYGIHTGLRISDLLKLKVGDVRDRTHINLRETKTKKAKRFKLNADLMALTSDFIGDREDSEYLFKSREGENKPISRFMAYKILSEAAHEADLPDIGTHTLRKTFGYHFYRKTQNIALLQLIFNHSSPKTTLRYIGIDQDEIDQAMDEFLICSFN